MRVFKESLLVPSVITITTQLFDYDTTHNG